MTNHPSTISSDELCSVHGGNGLQCTPDNPRGEPRYPHSVRALPPNHDGRSMSQRVIDATDRAMAPWKLFNGLFGGFGAGAPRPNMPPPPRPTY